MKKVGIVLLALVCFAAGFAFSRTYGKDIDLLKEPEPAVMPTEDPINRSTEILYTKDEYGWDNGVAIGPNDIYFHSQVTCRYSKYGYHDWFYVCVYEAVERGFKPCPSCCYNFVKTR